MNEVRKKFIQDLKDTRLQADKLIPFHDQIRGDLASIEVEIITARRAEDQQAIDANEKIRKRLLWPMNIISSLVQFMSSSAEDA